MKAMVSSFEATAGNGTATVYSRGIGFDRERCRGASSVEGWDFGTDSCNEESHGRESFGPAAPDTTYAIRAILMDFVGYVYRFYH